MNKKGLILPILIICYLLIFKIDVNADMINLIDGSTESWVSIGELNSYFNNYRYLGVINSSSYNTNYYNVNVLYSTAVEYPNMLIDICATEDIWAYRTSQLGQNCSDSCFSNQMQMNKTQYSCSSNGYQGTIYRLNVPVSKWQEGATTNNHLFLRDRLSFGTSSSNNIPITIYGFYLSNDNVVDNQYIDYSNTINAINSSINSSTTDIINNQNSNANNIINNQNTNSQNEINNANQNTQDIIDNQNANNQDLKDNINSQFNECIVGHNIFHFDSPGAVNDNNTTYTITGTGEDFTITNTSSSPKQIRYLFYNLGLIENQSKLYMYLSSVINSSSSNGDYSIGIYAYNNNCSDLSCFYSYHETIAEPVLTSGASNYNITNFNGKYLVVKLLLSDRNCNGILDRSCISKNYKDLTFSYSPVSSYESSEEVCTNRLDKTNDKLDSMFNADIDNNHKQLPDTSSFDDYKNLEDGIFNRLGSIDLSNMNIGIDTTTSSFIWDTMSSLFNSHASIFSLVITILSIGVIKLVLGR